MTAEPDSTAVRVALWRAQHVELDAPPHVFEDEVGLRLADPAPTWRERPDMDPIGTRGFRASIVARARFIEDLLADQVAGGIDQYVLLGAGLDSVVQRRPELASRLTVFEVDQPGPQAWKRERLLALGYRVPDSLRLVPVDFEVTQSWIEQLVVEGFDAARPAFVASTGVTMYLTEQATRATLRDLAALAPGSTVAMTFQLATDLLAPADRNLRAVTERAARASGTPFVSYYTPEHLLALARDAGFAEAEHVAGTLLAERYFAGRPDKLRPATGEDFLVARTG